MRWVKPRVKRWPFVAWTFYENGRWISCGRRAGESRVWANRGRWFQAWTEHRTACMDAREERPR